MLFRLAQRGRLLSQKSLAGLADGVYLTNAFYSLELADIDAIVQVFGYELLRSLMKFELKFLEVLFVRLLLHELNEIAEVGLSRQDVFDVSDLLAHHNNIRIGLLYFASYFSDIVLYHLQLRLHSFVNCL